ncbi:MAG: serine/threonine protein phosphatase [Thermoleophilia bacterium]|nr:serine/threonine protein phosphatase [Thermoleophilia bacterium]
MRPSHDGDPLDVSFPGRTIAIGDIHGCRAALDAVLAAIDLAPDDLIITLGDYVNRGPDSRGVLDRLIALGDSCRYVPILGNHDETLRNVLAGEWSEGDLLESVAGATIASYGKGRDLSVIPKEHVDFLNRCVDVFETDTHFFTHANYLPGLPLPGQYGAVLRWESLRVMIPEPHVSGRPAVLGHTSQKSGEILDLGHIVCIDTYCYGGGWLTAFDVHARTVWQADRRGKARRPWVLPPAVPTRVIDDLD